MIVRFLIFMKKKIEEFKINDNLRRKWHFFSNNPINVLGLIVVSAIIFIAIFAPFISPYPESAGTYYDFDKASQPPSLDHWFGTDIAGRDIMTRVFFGFRISLILGMIIMFTAAPFGTLVGLIAGYYRDTWIDTIIMRVTDIFMCVPALVMAMSISSVFVPGIISSISSVSLVWWGIYSRLAYSSASSLKGEYFIQSAETIGASVPHILFKEILPNYLSPLLTKVTLDLAWVILLGSTLSFVGLGAQEPTPDLGTMIASGSGYLPNQWWMFVFPALAVVIIILGFNLLGDGIGDLFGEK